MEKKSNIFNREIQPIKSIIDDLIYENNWDEKIALNKIRTNLNVILSEIASKHFKVVSLEKKLLTVKAESPVWKFEMIQREAEITEKINKFIGYDCVNSLKVI